MIRVLVHGANSPFACARRLGSRCGWDCRVFMAMMLITGARDRHGRAVMFELAYAYPRTGERHQVRQPARIARESISV
jgi:hypothetical protein